MIENLTYLSHVINNISKGLEPNQIMQYPDLSQSTSILDKKLEFVSNICKQDKNPLECADKLLDKVIKNQVGEKIVLPRKTSRIKKRKFFGIIPIIEEIDIKIIGE